MFFVNVERSCLTCSQSPELNFVVFLWSAGCVYSNGKHHTVSIEVACFAFIGLRTINKSVNGWKSHGWDFLTLALMLKIL